MKIIFGYLIILELERGCGKRPVKGKAPAPKKSRVDAVETGRRSARIAATGEGQCQMQGC